MPWLLASPGHQQPCYWPCKINRSLSSPRKDFNNQHHLSCGKWWKMQTFSMLPQNDSAYKGLTHWGWDKMSTIFQATFSNAFSWMKMYKFLLRFSLKFVPRGTINKIPALVQIMVWRRPGDKPLSEPMVVSLLMHICVTRPQWVNIGNSTAWWPYGCYDGDTGWWQKWEIAWGRPHTK